MPTAPAPAQPVPLSHSVADTAVLAVPQTRKPGPASGPLRLPSPQLEVLTPCLVHSTLLLRPPHPKTSPSSLSAFFFFFHNVRYVLEIKHDFVFQFISVVLTGQGTP